LPLIVLEGWSHLSKKKKRLVTGTDRDCVRHRPLPCGQDCGGCGFGLVGALGHTATDHRPPDPRHGEETRRRSGVPGGRT
jgi:hypothetical protein